MHIDIWTGHGLWTKGDGLTMRREMEGQAAIDYATTGPGSVKGLPYFNGYYLQTALHDDGECDQHHPYAGQERGGSENDG